MASPRDNALPPITFVSPFASTSTSPPVLLPAQPAFQRLRPAIGTEADRRKSVGTFAPSRPRMLAPKVSEEAPDMRVQGGKNRPTTSPESSSREALFADHLSAILNHSLSLCAASEQQPVSQYVTDTCGASPPLTPDSSPRASLGETSLSSSPPPRRVQRLPSLPSITPSRRYYLIDLLQEWSFNAHELDSDELWECAAIMFECVLSMDGVDPGVPIERIRALLISLRAAYHERNAYHNFMHATDVLQSCYSFLVALGVAPPVSTLLSDEQWSRSDEVEARGGLGEVLRPMDVFALMIAAIGHDVGHPGLSNAYMVNARTPVAQVYGGKSCLENFHSITLVQMLKKYGFGPLFEIEGAESDFRRVMMASVLATDMSSHFPIVAKLQEAARRLEGRIRTVEEIEDDRLLICSCLMKCSDISNPSRPHEIARAWSTCLLEEWAEQARIEAEYKLPISVVTLNPAEKRAQAKSQVGFINLFTQPLFDSMASLVPDFAPFAAHSREGRRFWEEVVLDVADVPETTSPPPLRLRPSSGSFHATSSPRRSAPPPSLQLPRRSVDSDATTTSEEVSPLFPLSSHSTSTIDSEVLEDDEDEATPPANGEPACDGSCASVTARCAACMAKERKAKYRATNQGTSPALLAAAQRDWPPYPFCPTTTPAPEALRS